MRDTMLTVAKALVYEAVLGVALVVGLPLVSLEILPRGALLAEGVQPVGLGLIVVGGLVWLAAAATLVTYGAGTPLPLDPPRRLVDRGPYRLSRNPMHLGLVVLLLGEALLFRSLTAVLVVAVLAAGLAYYVLRVEEPELATRFGRSYDDYRGRVPRWLGSSRGHARGGR